MAIDPNSQLSVRRTRRAALFDTLKDDAAAVLQSVVNEVAPTVVNAIDVGEVVDRVDIQAVIDRVDLNSVLARVDVEQLVDRVDVVRVLIASIRWCSPRSSTGSSCSSTSTR